MKMKKGNPQLENGYTQIANELLEALFGIYLSDNERRILGCIIRYTYGFKKKTSKLSLSLIAKATGILPPNVARAKKKLLKKNIVIQTDNHELGLQKKYKKWKVIRMDKLSKQILSKQIMKVIQADNRKLSKQIGDTIKRKLLKKTIKKKRVYSSLSNVTEKDFQEISVYYKVPIAFVRSKYDDMVLWAGERPNNPKTKGRNWRLTLMRWVKTDAIKIAEGRWQNDKKKGIDATNL